MHRIYIDIACRSGIHQFTIDKAIASLAPFRRQAVLVIIRSCRSQEGLFKIIIIKRDGIDGAIMIIQIGIQAGVLTSRLQFVRSHRILVEQLTGEIGDRTHLSAAGNDYCHHIDTVAILKGLLAADSSTIQISPCARARIIQYIQAQIKETGCKTTSFMSPPNKLGFIGIIDTPLHNASLHHRRTEIRLLNPMRLIFSKNMMLIDIIHWMEIIV